MWGLKSKKMIARYDWVDPAPLFCIWRVEIIKNGSNNWFKIEMRDNKDPKWNWIVGWDRSRIVLDNSI